MTKHPHTRTVVVLFKVPLFKGKSTICGLFNAKAPNHPDTRAVVVLFKVSLFKGKSTIVGYSMPKYPTIYKNSSGII